MNLASFKTVSVVFTTIYMCCATYSILYFVFFYSRYVTISVFTLIEPWLRTGKLIGEAHSSSDITDHHIFRLLIL